MADIPPEDPAVYDMICEADTVGVFQIESRAQMSMLPRLGPRNYYDLVIEIAIVRPGPIQGEMVHPYLARRSGREPVTYPSEAVRTVLERTLGVPIFQEQVMQLAMVAAGFSAGEADQLRRAMAAWKRKGGLEQFETRLLEGMRGRGYAEAFARQIFSQIKGFGEYGFPESHSASFALLAYVSAWLKRHHPAAFTCALLNSQPMGFYAPAQLVQDARRHGVEVRPVDVQYSAWDCTLEHPTAPETHSGSSDYGTRTAGTGRNHGAGTGFPGVRESPEPVVRETGAVNRQALRLGLRRVKGLSRRGGEAIAKARRSGPFDNARDLVARTGLDKRDLECLAAADALAGLEGHRHNAWWRAGGIEPPMPLFGVPRFDEEAPMLREPGEGEDIVADYASTGMTLRRHPLALLRRRLSERRFHTAAELATLRNGAVARGAGLVLVRQRPATASGVIFTTLEDETGTINVVVWPSTAQTQRRALLKARLLAVTGTLQRESGVVHLIAGRLEDLSQWLGDLETASRNFH